MWMHSELHGVLLSCRGFLTFEKNMKAKTKRELEYGTIRTATLDGRGTVQAEGQT